MFALAVSLFAVGATPNAARSQGGSGPPPPTSSAPAITLLYQNFPNPFPSPVAQGTCVWFDLAIGGAVRLEIYTLRGERVRTLVPADGLGPVLPPGRYGRAFEGVDAGCDPRLRWDGRAGDGRLVPPGVYLIRLRAPGADGLRKALVRAQ